MSSRSSGSSSSSMSSQKQFGGAQLDDILAQCLGKYLQYDNKNIVQVLSEINDKLGKILESSQVKAKPIAKKKQ